MVTAQLINPNSITPVNGIEDEGKYRYLVEQFEEHGYEGRPIVAIGEEGEQLIALTGSHRIWAAIKAEIDVPVVLVPYDSENPLIVELADAKRDDERAQIARELYENGDISEEAYNLLAREDDLNFENYDVPYAEQIRYSRRDSSEGLTKEEARAQAQAYTRLKAENTAAAKLYMQTTSSSFTYRVRLHA